MAKIEVTHNGKQFKLMVEWKKPKMPLKDERRLRKYFGKIIEIIEKHTDSTSA